MKKKFLAMLLLAVLLAMSMAQAVLGATQSWNGKDLIYSIEGGAEVYYKADGEITGYKKDDIGALIIPAEINNIEINKISQWAFRENIYI